ncbi:hypothetical protein MTO96_048383 [Rhipicephalus appendiculatus]
MHETMAQRVAAVGGGSRVEGRRGAGAQTRRCLRSLSGFRLGGSFSSSAKRARIRPKMSRLPRVAATGLTQRVGVKGREAMPASGLGERLLFPCLPEPMYVHPFFFPEPPFSRKPQIEVSRCLYV